MLRLLFTISCSNSAIKMDFKVLLILTPKSLTQPCSPIVKVEHLVLTHSDIDLNRDQVLRNFSRKKDYNKLMMIFIGKEKVQ